MARNLLLESCSVTSPFWNAATPRRPPRPSPAG
jgi:hypothetical protein